MIPVESPDLLCFRVSVAVQSSRRGSELALQSGTGVCCTLSAGPWTAGMGEGRENEGGMEMGGRDLELHRS